MVRVPLPFRGVAVLLLAAATAAGQTPEPPSELLPLDSAAPSPPEILQQFASDARHPLLSLMVNGEMTAFEESAAPDTAKLKPTPQKSSAASKAPANDDCVLDGGLLDGCSSGTGLLDGCSFGNECFSGANYLPFACSPPPQQGCGCRKCQRQRRRGHGHGGGQGCGSGHGSGYGNPYFDFPTCPAWCFYGAPLEPGSYGCHGRHCGGRRHHSRHQNCGANYGMGYGGYLCEGFCQDCAPPPQQRCRRCQRRQHGCSSGYGNQGGNGYGYWGMGEGYGCMNAYYGNNQGCGHHSRRSRRHRCHGGNQQYPYCAYPMMMPGWGEGASCMGDGTFGGDLSFGNEFGLGQDAVVLDSGD